MIGQKTRNKIYLKEKVITIQKQSGIILELDHINMYVFDKSWTSILKYYSE